MDRSRKAWYRMALENRFLKLKRDAFQEFFADLMERAHPGDFERTKTSGPKGDRGCDEPESAGESRAAACFGRASLRGAEGGIGVSGVVLPPARRTSRTSRFWDICGCLWFSVGQS